MLLSNIEFLYTHKRNGIYLNWSYIENCRYVLTRKRIGIPTSIYDGTILYDGLDTSYFDNSIQIDDIYYYRLFVYYNYPNEFVSDLKCILKVNTYIHYNEYADYIYKSLPTNVKADDKNINQDYPLYRFMKIFAFPFNKIDTLSNKIINQVDIDKCDEHYLQNHSDWLGQFYDKRFGSDLNRILLKAINDAEPYIGTTVGLKYILQRIFKAEIEIDVVKDIDGHGYTNAIRLFFDEDSKWLSDESVSESIYKIIKNYCALRTKFSLSNSLISFEEYYLNKNSDEYIDKLFDAQTSELLTITNKTDDEYIFIVDKTDDVQSFNPFGILNKKSDLLSNNFMLNLNKLRSDDLTDIYIYSPQEEIYNGALEVTVDKHIIELDENHNKQYDDIISDKTRYDNGDDVLTKQFIDTIIETETETETETYPIVISESYISNIIPSSENEETNSYTDNENIDNYIRTRPLGILNGTGLLSRTLYTNDTIY